MPSAWSLNDNRSNQIAVGFFIAILIILAILWVRRGRVGDAKTQPFLDYMPTAVQPCPSSYKCGATSIAQVAMENNLFSDLREANAYTLPETTTSDEVDVVPTEAEPTACMISRASKAREGPMGEGQYTPYAEIEDRFLGWKPKERTILKQATEKAEASMRSSERPMA